ncbi:hypothetical protein [Vreelandella maris]|uniref:Mu-like prophage FluMu N-terminal domain-containing protein n=1 Tax=Vreelandella maris TaxID=2729617 RepID=A0A7Y6RFI7_9GAMM|nr:hypothetical protein [Halomonas maris]NVF15993.1 hypothetical protein [Halomonas maris]
MATRKTTATKAKQATQAKPTEAKAEPVAETTAEASAPETNQEASATSTDAASQQPTPEANAAAVQPVPETQTLADSGAASADQEAQANADAATAAPQPTEIQGDTVTGDGPGNALPPVQELPGVFVRTKRRVKSRRRAGFRFNREGVGIALELLSEEQLEQLREDPALEVTDCTFPVDDATTSEA